MIEPVEPRLLYSADFAAAFTGGAAGVGALFDERRLDAPSLQASLVQAAPRAEIALVDGLLPAADGRLAELQARQQAGQPLEIVKLNAADDGIARATELLRGRTDVGTLHLLGRTVDGTLQLGRTALDAPTLLARAGELAAWGQALAPGAQLVLPGSPEAAAGLAALTGADVATAAPRALIVVAANLPDSAQLVAGLRASSPGHTEVLMLAADRDALAQIGERLAQAERPFDAVHLVSHAAPGRVDLGTTVGDRWLDEATLQARHEELARWSTGFTADGDLLLYGCDLAGSAAGERLLAGLGDALGVDVAASSDATGAAAQGGDWALEVRLGEVAPGAPLAATAWTSTLASVTANVFTDVVDGNTSSISALIANPGADGGISLREAVLAANATGASDEVTLQAGTYTLATPLTVTQPLEIVGAGESQTFIAGGTTRLLASPAEDLELRQLTLNDAPTVSAPVSFSFTEDIAGNLLYTGTPFADVDSTNLTVTLSIADGTITGNAGTGITVGGTGTARTFSGTTADLNSYFTTAGRITYTGALNVNNDLDGTRTLTTTVFDGSLSASATSTVIIASVNDAPTLNEGQSPVLTTLGEDSPAPSGVAGTLVSALVGGLNDDDSGALKGIAITATNTTNGTLWYSTNGGSNWIQVSPVSTTSALLLAADARLYYQPAANYNGTTADALTFRAWDTSTGSAGTKVDPGAGGGTSAFSTNSDTVAVTVTAVNDAPTLNAGQSPVLTSLAEDSPAPSGVAGTLVSDLVGGISDVDSGALKGIAITATNTTNGTLWYSTNGGSSWVQVSTVSTTSALLLAADARLYYQPAANYNGTTADALTFRAWDTTTGSAGTKVNPGVGGGTSAFSTNSDTVAVTVSAVNDAPTIVPPTGVLRGHQDQPTQFASILNRIEVADIDAGGSALSVTISASDGAHFDVGSVSGLNFDVGDGLSDPTATFSGTLASLNGALQSLRLQPAAGFIGLVSVTVEVNDQGNSGQGGSLTAVANFQVDFVANSKPVLQLSGSTPDYVENAAALALDPALVLSDADNPNLMRAVVQITSGLHAADLLTVTPTAGIVPSFNTTTGVLTLTGSASVADYQATLRTVAYSSTSDHPTQFSATRSMRWFVEDSVSASLIQNSSLTITAVNDAPTLNAGQSPVLTTLGAWAAEHRRTRQGDQDLRRRG